jgi:hypothetical protein
MILYVRRTPEEPEPTAFVQTVWKDEDISWSSTDESVEDAVRDLVKVEEEWQGDEKEITALLLEQHRQQETAARHKAEIKARLFADMVDNLSRASGLSADEVRQSLQDMRVFKIYPDHSDLEPVEDTFGTHTFKTAFVNRYIGKANEVC